MSRYKVYPEYKDSGLQWMGVIPKHWDIVYSKAVFQERNEKASIEDEQLTASQKYGILPQKLFMEIEQQRVVQVLKGQEILKRVEKNDFVISMRSFQGGIEFSPYSGSISSAYVPLFARVEVSNGFFKYFLKSEPYIQALQSTTNLVRDGQALRYANFVQVTLPRFPVIEQEKIANFLDHETAKIDTLIAKQQELIKLLKEKRQAVISHAVTKGLNPNAPMRDSGIEWLGEVPAHWNLPKLKWISKTESGGTPNTSKFDDYYLEGEIPWVRTTDLNNGELLETPVRITKKAVQDSACSLLPVDSVLVAMYGGSGSIGKHSILKFESTINQAVCAILPNPDVVAEFLHLYIEFYRPFWMVGAEGTRKDPNINQDTIRELYLPIPPKFEQSEIVDFVRRKVNLIDSVIQQSESNIELMQERRTALISAAVTGKIDVRDWEGK